MERQDNAKRCANKGCTCHVFADAKYCSDKCREAGEKGRNEVRCNCGHAGCSRSEYVPSGAEASRHAHL